jgi:hypothetical protein
VEVAVEVCRYTNHLIFVVNGEGVTRRVSLNGAEILHSLVFSPQEGVPCGVTRQVRGTNDMPEVVNALSNIHRASQVAEVFHLAIFSPEYGV